MKSHKHILGLLAMSAMVSSMASGPFSSSGTNDVSINGGIPEKPKKVIPKGCKEYTFSGITVIASSEKSARKKIQKKLNNETTTTR